MLGESQIHLNIYEYLSCILIIFKQKRAMALVSVMNVTSIISNIGVITPYLL